LLPRPPRSPPFPYTTLFRSRPACAAPRYCRGPPGAPLRASGPSLEPDAIPAARLSRGDVVTSKPAVIPGLAKREPGTQESANRRSEEHTSELQSLTNLVCRL